MKDILIASLFMAAGRYTDMPIWQLSLCLALAGWSLKQIGKVKRD